MSDKNITLKFVFGLMVFAFSLALAYFSASYLRNEASFDYWGVLLVFAGVYILVGMLVSMIYPVSLGFLFSADVLILNVLFENFGDWMDISKAMVVGVILLVLYLFAWIKLSDENKPSLSEVHPENFKV